MNLLTLRPAKKLPVLIATLVVSSPTWATYPMGLAWDDTGYLWVSHVDNGTIYRVDPTSGQALSSFTPFADVYAGTPYGNDRIRDLAWDGKWIWAAYWTDPMLVQTGGDINELPSKVYAFDPVTGAVVSSFTAPFSGHPDGLAWDGESLWVGEEDGRVYEVDPLTGLSPTSIEVPDGGVNTSNPRGLAWDGSALWVGYQSLEEDQIRRIDLNGNVLAAIDSPYGACQQGLAFDGASLWAAGSCGTTTISQIDPTTGAVLRVLTMNPVPEPGTFALFALGVVGLAAVGRRRARTAAMASAKQGGPIEVLGAERLRRFWLMA